MAARRCLLIFVACRATARYALAQTAECISTADACVSHVSVDDESDSVELLQLQRGLISTGQKALPGPDPRSLPPVTTSIPAEQPLDDEGQSASSETNDAVESIAGWISDVGHAVADAETSASVAAHDSDGASSEANAVASSITGQIANWSNAVADIAESVGARASTEPNAVTAESVAGWIADAVATSIHAEQPLDDEGQSASSEASDGVKSIAGWISDVGRALADASANVSVAVHDPNGPDSEAIDVSSSITVRIANLSNAVADVAESVGARASTEPNAVTAESVAGWIAEAVVTAVQERKFAANESDGTSPEVISAAASIAGWMANISRAVAGAAEINFTIPHDNDVADFGDVLGTENLKDVLNNVSKAVASAVVDLESQLVAQANKTMTIAAARLVMRMGSAKSDTADRLVDALLAERTQVANLLAQIDRDGLVENAMSARLPPLTAVIQLLIMGAADLTGSTPDELCRSSSDSKVQREALVQRSPEPDPVADARIALRDADAAMAMTSAFASRLRYALEQTQALVEGLLDANEENNWPHEGARELQDGLVAATLNVSRLLTTDFVAEEVARLREEKQAEGDSHGSLLQTALLIVGSLSFIALAVWLALRPS